MREAANTRAEDMDSKLPSKYVLFSWMQRDEGVIRYRMLLTQKEKTMKRIFIFLLALALAACGAPPATEAPTAAPAQPTATAVVVVQTVVVTVIPTQAPTEVPSATPLPPPTEVPPTQALPTETPAQPAAPTVAAADTSEGLFTVEDTLGAGWFASMTRTASAFSFRCQLSKDITFSVKPTDPNITEVNFYYRIEDRGTGAVFDWQNAGRMLPDASGNFALVFSGENVNANFRKPNAWFDYQFIGLSRSGGVVGRSEKIVQQVTYTLDCP
jgi:hypothetical protein